MSKDNDRALVTGATGFIGGHAVRRLIAEGRPVRILARSGSDQSAIADLDYEVAAGDITDPDSVRSAMKGCRSCIHCAALVSDFGPWDRFRLVNVKGLGIVMDAALEAGIDRLVYFSTCDVLGIHKGGAVINDDMPLKRTGFPYPDTKIEAEELFREYVETKGLRGVALRPAWVYGPGDRTFLPEIVDALRQRFFFYFGSRKNVLCLAYVDNIMDAVMLALTRDEALGREYTVCDGVPVAWEELVERIAAPLGLRKPRLQVPMFAALGLARGMEVWAGLSKAERRPMLTRYAVTITGSDMRYSNQRIVDELGFEPKILPDEGIIRSVEWLQGQDLAGIKKK